jgi:hypothetical protein
MAFTNQSQISKQKSESLITIEENPFAVEVEDVPIF